MKQYVLRRLVLAVPTLFLVSVIVFALMRLMPGDVATRMVEGHGYARTLDATAHSRGVPAALPGDPGAGPADHPGLGRHRRGGRHRVRHALKNAMIPVISLIGL